MRITKNQLRQIIKEELAGVLREDEKEDEGPKDAEETIKVKKDGEWVDTGTPGTKITAKPPKEDKEEKAKTNESRRRKVRKARKR